LRFIALAAAAEQEGRRRQQSRGAHRGLIWLRLGNNHRRRRGLRKGMAPLGWGR